MYILIEMFVNKFNEFYNNLKSKSEWILKSFLMKDCVSCYLFRNKIWNEMYNTVSYFCGISYTTYRNPMSWALYTCWSLWICSHLYLEWDIQLYRAGSAKSVRCAVRLVFRRSQVRSSGQAPSFVEIWSWNNFSGHSLPAADSSRAVVSYWRKYGHLVLINRFGSLPRNSVDRLTDHAWNDLNSVEEP